MKALIRPVEGPWGPRQRSTKGPLRYRETVSHPLVAHQVLDQLDLVGLVLGPEALDRLVGGDLGALEPLVRLDVRAIRSSIRSRSASEGRKPSGNSKS